MIKLKQLLTEKASYVTNCASADSGGLFNDATEMAQAVENSKPMSYEEFQASVDFSGAPRMLLLNLRVHPDRFTFGEYKNLLWAYDDDIHWFFV